MCNYLGNKELLKRRKIGFLASRKISSSAILPTLDWAVEISKQSDVAVVSGFHSRLEKDVLKFLLQGKCKHSVNHVFLSPTSIINFTSKKQSYDDTRRSSRDNELLQRAQSDL